MKKILTPEESFYIRGAVEIELSLRNDELNLAKIEEILKAIHNPPLRLLEDLGIADYYDSPQKCFQNLQIYSNQLKDIKIFIKIIILKWLKDHELVHQNFSKLKEPLQTAEIFLKEELNKLTPQIHIFQHATLKDQLHIHLKKNAKYIPRFIAFIFGGYLLYCGKFLSSSNELNFNISEVSSRSSELRSRIQLLESQLQLSNVIPVDISSVKAELTKVLSELKNIQIENQILRKVLDFQKQELQLFEMLYPFFTILLVLSCIVGMIAYLLPEKQDPSFDGFSPSIAHFESSRSPLLFSNSGDDKNDNDQEEKADSFKSLKIKQP